MTLRVAVVQLVLLLVSGFPGPSSGFDWKETDDGFWSKDCQFDGGDVIFSDTREPSSTCEAKCLNYGDCTHFNWVSPDGRTGTCYLKASDTLPTKADASETSGGDDHTCGMLKPPSGGIEWQDSDDGTYSNAAGCEIATGEVLYSLRYKVSGNCQSLCRNYPGCTHYNWVKAGTRTGTCYLKKSSGALPTKADAKQMVKESAYFCGMMKPAKSGIDWQESGVAYSAAGCTFSAGKALYTTRYKSTGQCESNCQNNPSCTHYNWVKTGTGSGTTRGTCYLKKADKTPSTSDASPTSKASDNYCGVLKRTPAGSSPSPSPSKPYCSFNGCPSSNANPNSWCSKSASNCATCPGSTWCSGGQAKPPAAAKAPAAGNSGSSKPYCSFNGCPSSTANPNSWCSKSASNCASCPGSTWCPTGPGQAGGAGQAKTPTAAKAPAGIDWQENDDVYWADGCDFKSDSIVKSQYSGDFDGCAEECLTHPQCTHYTYSSRKCHLRGNMKASKADASKSDSGLKCAVLKASPFYSPDIEVKEDSKTYWANGCSFRGRTVSVTSSAYTRDGCPDRCSTTSMCTHWNFVIDPSRIGTRGACHLKSGNAVTMEDADRTFPGAACGVLKSSPAYAGTDIDWKSTSLAHWANGCSFSTPVVSTSRGQLADCPQKCKAHNRCTHYNWVKTGLSSGTCYLKAGSSVSKSSASKVPPATSCGVLKSFLKPSNSPRPAPRPSTPNSAPNSAADDFQEGLETLYAQQLVQSTGWIFGR